MVRFFGSCNGVTNNNGCLRGIRPLTLGADHRWSLSQSTNIGTTLHPDLPTLSSQGTSPSVSILHFEPFKFNRPFIGVFLTSDGDGWIDDISVRRRALNSGV